MTDNKKPKKGVAVVISIGPKMKTKPTDAATPEMPMKKYGSMPMKKAMEVLKQKGKYVPTTAEDEYVASNSENRHHSMSNREKDEEWKEAQLDGRYDEDYYPDDETPIWDDDRQPIGKPEFGNEGAREAEMNQAERAAIMAEEVRQDRVTHDLVLLILWQTLTNQDLVCREIFFKIEGK